MSSHSQQPAQQPESSAGQEPEMKQTSLMTLTEYRATGGHGPKKVVFYLASAAVAAAGVHGVIVPLITRNGA